LLAFLPVAKAVAPAPLSVIKASALDVKLNPMIGKSVKTIAALSILLIPLVLLAL